MAMFRVKISRTFADDFRDFALKEELPYTTSIFKSDYAVFLTTSTFLVSFVFLWCEYIYIERIK